MRRITTWLLSTVSALVLLFSYHTSTSPTAAGVVAVGGAGTDSGVDASTDAPSSDTTTGGGSTSTDEATPTPSGSSSGAADSGSSSTASDGTYTGDAVMTRFGAVQVEITVSGGEITTSVVTQVPWSDRRDQQINSYAVPILNDETVQARSSDIDMVSGATYTSEGYIQSLQSAIDQANL
jgi:uncharacterized protein with FMN-binding domain